MARYLKDWFNSIARCYLLIVRRSRLTWVLGQWEPYEPPPEFIALVAFKGQANPPSRTANGVSLTACDGIRASRNREYHTKQYVY